MSAYSLLIRPALWGLAAGLAVGLSFFVGALPVVMELPGITLWQAFRGLVTGPATQITVLAILLGLAIQLTRGGWKRVAAIGVAIAIALAVNSILLKQLWKTRAMVSIPELTGTSNEHGLYGQWIQIAAGVLLVIYYSNHENLRLAAARLHAAQIARQRAEHAVLEWQLNVVRSRIDPSFLSDALEEVRSRYGESVGEAEALLDELIAFLQASLPQARERGSTLGREVALVATYLHLVSGLRGERIDTSIDVPPALRDVFFPPMVLLPLFNQAGRRAAIRTREDDGRLAITVEGSPAAADPESASLRNMRATLGAFFGPEARVVTVPAGSESRITIEYRRGDAAIGREAA